MVKLTCLLRRKEGLTPAEFHAHWKDVHGPLVANSRAGSHVIRYEQNPRPLSDYLEEYYAHMGEDDFPAMMADIATFLDVDHLEFVLTEKPLVVMDGEVDWS